MVSPVTKHFTSFAKMENFIELDIQPRSDNPLILFHDFDIGTGMLWSFKRFSNMLSQFRIREKSLCQRSPIEYMLPRELVVEPKATVVDMTLDEYEAINLILIARVESATFRCLFQKLLPSWNCSGP